MYMYVCILCVYPNYDFTTQNVAKCRASSSSRTPFWKASLCRAQPFWYAHATSHKPVRGHAERSPKNKKFFKNHPPATR